jgi:hypothetical protein
MDEEILDALIELKGAVQKQTSLQEQTNKLLQVLINVLSRAGKP